MMSKRAREDEQDGVPDAKRARTVADALLQGTPVSPTVQTKITGTNERHISTLAQLGAHMLSKRALGGSVAHWEHMMQVKECVQEMNNIPAWHVHMSDFQKSHCIVQIVVRIRRVLQASFYLLAPACFWKHSMLYVQYVEQLTQGNPITIHMTDHREEMDRYTHELSVRLSTTRAVLEEWACAYKALLWFLQVTAGVPSECSAPKKYEKMAPMSIHECMCELAVLIKHYVCLLGALE